MQGNLWSLPGARELLECVFTGGVWITPRSRVQDRPAVCFALQCYCSAKNAVLQITSSDWQLVICGLNWE